MTAVTPPRFERSPHLVGLVAEAERLAALVAGAEPDGRARLARRLQASAARATLVLDGVPTGQIPNPDDALAAAGEAFPAARASDPTGTWLDALRVVDAPADQVVRALEVLGAVAGAAGDDDLVRLVSSDPVQALRALHRRMTRGLVPADRAGTLRTTSQAVVDASTGRVLYFAPEPDTVAGQIAFLGDWVASAGTREHPLISSGILHLEVLRIHPFEVANGRVARAAARLLLRGRGLDPDGLAAAEVVLAGDPLGTSEEIARTLRRRDATIWLERWGEAVTGALGHAARRLAMLAPAVPDRAEAFLAAQEDDVFTLADYRAGAGVTAGTARGDLQALLDTGRVERVPVSRGLRFRVPRTDRHPQDRYPTTA